MSWEKRHIPCRSRFSKSLPTFAGIALGLDRLVMVLLDAATIDQVVAFTPEDM